MACAAVAAREGDEAGALKSIVATVDHLHSLSATYPEVNELRHEIAQAEQRAVVTARREIARFDSSMTISGHVPAFPKMEIDRIRSGLPYLRPKP